MTKLHWTQRPENKTKVQRMLKKSAKARRSNKRKHKPETRNDAPDFTKTREFGYALGHVEAWIQSFAASVNRSYEDVAAPLGKALSIAARR